MVLVIVTDARPAVALRQIYSRIGFVFFPLSMVLIKYTNLGVSYDELGPHYTGVTTNKNAFGLMLYVFTIGVVWNIRALILDRKASNRGQRLVAQVTLLGFGILLLQMAHSATSIFCFILGSGLMLATGLPIVKKRPSTLHTLCFGILLFGTGGVLLGGAGAVTGALGRTSDFSGRTEIWAAAIASADNQWVGTGFESFWNKNNPKVAHILQSQGYADMSILNSAHNGYLQIYLDLGWMGVCLLAFILGSGYLRAVKAFRLNHELGSLFLAYLITCAFASITEAGFRIMTLSWIFLLLAVVGATGVIVRVAKVKEQGSRAPRTLASIEKVPVQRRSPAARVIRTVAQRVSFVCGSYWQNTSLDDLPVHDFS
jgi:O-antigen ligase